MKVLKQRQCNRLKDYDYSQDGAYFVTICVKNREELFGDVHNGKVDLNEYGKIVKKFWHEIPDHFPNMVLDEFVVMPNHVHGILIIVNSVGNKNFCSLQNRNIYLNKTNGDNGNKDFCFLQKNKGNKDFCSLQKNKDIPWQKKISRSVSSVIRGFKIGVTKYFRKQNNFEFQWQKSFYDHIIRNENSLFKIRKYIQNNPLKWHLEKDRNHLLNIEL